MKKLIIYSFLILSIIIFALGGYVYYKRHPHPPDGNKIYGDQLSGIYTVLQVRLDYEDLSLLDNTSTASSEKYFSGKNSCKLSSKAEYGSCLSLPLNTFDDFNDITQVVVTSKIYSADADEASWVLQIDDKNGKVVYWTNIEFPKTNELWKEDKTTFELDTIIENGTTLKIYPWNKSLKTIFIDDVIIDFQTTHKSAINKMASDKSRIYCDFESPEQAGTPNLSSKQAHSGTNSVLLNLTTEYGPQFCKTISQVTNDTLSRISASVWLYPQKEKLSCSMVLIIKDKNGKQVFWSEKSVKNSTLHKNEWNKFNTDYSFSPEEYRKFQSTDNACIFLWNRDGSDIYADDFEIVFGTELPRSGTSPNVDVQELAGKSYSFDPYKPPFQFQFFENEKIDVSPFLPQNPDNKYEFFPTDHFLSANTDGDDKNELLRFRNDSLDICSYDDVTRKFQCKTCFIPSLINPSLCQFLSGDINGDGVEELIVMNPTTSKIQTYGFKNISENKLKLLSEIDLPIKRIRFISCGKFDITNHSELLFFENESSKFFIMSYANDNWKINHQGNYNLNIGDAAITGIVTGKFLNNQTDNIIITYTVNNSIGLTTLQYIEFGNTFQSDYPAKNILNYFSGNSILLKGNFDNDNLDELILFNTKNRFDMKLIDKNDNGFYINGQVEFKGYTSNENPKFYEFPLAITGNFINKNNTSILFVLRNCNDNSFDGKHCNSYSNIPYLPNTVEFYSTSK